MSNNLVVASSDDPKGSVMGPSDVGAILSFVILLVKLRKFLQCHIHMTQLC